MNIVLDASILFDHWDFKSHSIEMLSRFVLDKRHKIIVPEIVVEELVKHCEKRFIEHSEQMSRSLGSIRVLLDRDIRNEICEDGEQTGKEYRKRLAKWLERVAGNIVSMDVPIRSIALKSLLDKKPFGKKKKDCLRDAIIWSNVLSVAISDKMTETVLVSANCDDFSEGKGMNIYHVDLKGDLADIDASERVKLCLSLDDLTSDFRKHLKVLDGVLNQIREDSYPAFHLKRFMGAHEHEIAEKVNDAIGRLDSKYFAPFASVIDPRLGKPESRRLTVRTVTQLDIEENKLIVLELNIKTELTFKSSSEFIGERTFSFTHFFQIPAVGVTKLVDLAGRATVTCELSLILDKAGYQSKLDVKIESFKMIDASGDTWSESTYQK